MTGWELDKLATKRAEELSEIDQRLTGLDTEQKELEGRRHEAERQYREVKRQLDVSAQRWAMDRNRQAGSLPHD